MFIPIRKSPPRIAYVFDDQGNEVTDDIRPFLGPGEKFYTTVAVTPEMLGYGGLEIQLLDGKPPLKLLAKDPICLDKSVVSVHPKIESVKNNHLT